MATVGFIGLGQMGGGMSRNILKGGHTVRAAQPAKAAAVPCVSVATSGTTRRRCAVHPDAWSKPA